jgi:hypothetical protein
MARGGQSARRNPSELRNSNECRYESGSVRFEDYQHPAPSNLADGSKPRTTDWCANSPKSALIWSEAPWQGKPSGHPKAHELHGAARVKLVPGGGVEPPRAEARRILSPNPLFSNFTIHSIYKGLQNCSVSFGAVW